MDNGPAEFATPTALSDELVTAVLPDNVALFNSFRRGRTLYVKVRGTDLDTIPFNLTDTSQMLAYLLRCAQNGGVKPSPAVAAAPNMFGTPNTANTQATPTDTKSESSPVAQKAEATLLAANLVSELGITGFKFLTPEETPKGITADAMWAAGKDSWYGKYITNRNRYWCRWTVPDWKRREGMQKGFRVGRNARRGR